MGSATARGVVAGSAAARGAALEPPAGGGEERRTRGLEIASSAGLHHTKVGDGEERGGGGGGGGTNERSWPINGPIKWLEQKNREINGRNRKRRVCRRRKAKGEEQWACEFSQGAKISR